MEERLEAFGDWLASRGRSQLTREQYVSQARLAFGHPDPLTRLRSRSLAPKSKRAVKAALVAWATFSGDMGLLERLKDLRLPPPARSKAKRIFSRDEWATFRDETEAIEDEPTRAVLGMMTYRGFRRGDTLRLTKRDVDSALSSGALVFEAKGGRLLEFGVIPTYRPCLELLADYRGWDSVCDLISPTFESAGRQIARVVKETGEAIGFEGAHPHLLRSTYATYYYQACGADPAKLKEHMQWASLETAMQYVVQHNRDELDDIAAGMF